MALNVQAGTYTFPTGTGLRDIITGLSFAPKVYIPFYTRSTANATFSSTLSYGMGVGVDRATDQAFRAGGACVDNQSTTLTQTLKSTSGIIIRPHSDASSNYDLSASHNTFKSDGAEVNVTFNTGSVLSIVKWLALGGADLEDAYAAEWSITAGTGNKSFTTCPFQPTMALFITNRVNASGDAGNAGYGVGFGATNGTQQAAVTWTSSTGATSTPYAYTKIYNNRCVCVKGGTQDFEASFVSFNSDGMTINLDTDEFASTRHVFVLFLKGTFQSDIGVQARPTSNTTQDITTTFQPVGGLIAGGYATAVNTETSGGNHIVFGAFDDTINNHGTWAGDSDTINTDTNQYASNSNVYTQATNPSTVAAQAAVSAILSNGFRMNWTTTDANARQYMHVAFGSQAAGPESTARGLIRTYV